MPERELDRIDYAILAALQTNGRISNVELSRQVNLSPSPCLDRVRRLEADGYIEGYAAKLSAAKLGMGTSAFIQVTLDRTTGERVLEILLEEQVARGVSLLLVTHDERLAQRCERVVYMEDGQISGDSSAPIPD